MDKVGGNSSEAVGRKDKLEDSLDVDGCGESGDSGKVSSDEVAEGPSLDWVANVRGLVTVFSVISQGAVVEGVADAKS